MTKIAIVTGGNKGIGYAIVRALAKRSVKVILTARNPSLGHTAAAQLLSEKLPVEFLPLDVSQESSINDFVSQIAAKYPKIDILINNAGIFRGWDESWKDANPKDILESLQTNTMGPLLLSQKLLPFLKKSDDPCIVNVSSGMGGITEMGGHSVPYRFSKVALNALTKIIHAEGGVRVNSMCPGYVKTDMTGGENSKAPRTPEKGAETAIWLALDTKESGGFWRDKMPLNCAPHMHAHALELLKDFLQPGMRALDVGSGSGFLTCCMGKMVGGRGRVIGVDHIEGLVELAKRNTMKTCTKLLQDGVIEYKVGDGRLGDINNAPFNAIHVGAAAPKMPNALVEQLASPGRMIIPVGMTVQALKQVDKDVDGNVTVKNLTGVIYVPLTDAEKQLQ